MLAAAQMQFDTKYCATCGSSTTFQNEIAARIYESAERKIESRDHSLNLEVDIAKYLRINVSLMKSTSIFANTIRTRRISRMNLKRRRYLLTAEVEISKSLN